jgi:CMP-N-acetylneuraminic acid synthetase
MKSGGKMITSGQRCVAIIPARGGSKRIPHKNTVLLDGEPLVAYTIRAALAAEHIGRLMVTTDDGEIARISAEQGAEVLYPRPPELSTDTASTIDVMKYVVRTLETDGTEFDPVVLLQPTSPFRTGENIDAAIELFFMTGADTVTAVRTVTDHAWWQWQESGERIVPLYTFEHLAMGRHQLPKHYIENGAIYVLRRSTLFRDGLYGPKVVPFVMGPIESIDIDEPLDLSCAEFLLSQRSVQLGKRV